MTDPSGGPPPRLDEQEGAVDGTVEREATCRVVVDLRGAAWARDPQEVRRRLLPLPGVVDVRPDPSRERAHVLHRAGASMAALHNAVLRCRAEP